MVSNMVTPKVTKVEEKDMGWKQIKLDFKELKNMGVKVGIMGTEEIDGVAVVDYATYNELGTRFIPARPFMGTTADRYRDGIYQYTATLVGKMIDGVYDARQVLTYIGEWYQAKVQLTIRDAKQWSVPLLPATIKAKGSSSPLIDTGRMIQSVRYEIVGLNEIQPS